MRIETYNKDLQVTVNDFVIGTDGDKFNKTKNFPIHKLADFFLAQLTNSGVVFRFSDGSDGTLPGTLGNFTSELGLTNKTVITRLNFSKTSFYGEELAALFASVGSNLGDLYMGLTQQDDTANYGFFNVNNVIDQGDYFQIDVALRGTLYAKDFLVDKNYALFFDLASSNEFSISIVAGIFMLYKNGALVDQVDMSVYMDDTNLAQLISGSVDANGIATFTRSDATSFTVNFSQFLSGIMPTKTSDLINDGNDGLSFYVTRAETYIRSEIDNKDAFIQAQVTLLNGLYLFRNTTLKTIELRNGAGTVLSSIVDYDSDGAGYSLYFDSFARTLFIYDIDGNVVDSIPVSLILDNIYLETGGYVGTAQTLKLYIDSLADKNYLHTQAIPSATWNVAHNLGKFPSVTVLNDFKTEVTGEVVHTDINNLTINFHGGFSGTATLN